ncbi:MAG: sterol desaturase family protein [Sandaracinaceae bacterium]
MELTSQLLPSFLVVLVTAAFFVAERVWPGRPLPHRAGWHLRALFLNGVQVAMLGVAGLTWNLWFREYTWLSLGDWAPAPLQGFVYWFALTFVFYWWHRLRHANGFWGVFHQIHHSPSRIEVLTSFYKHPIEIAVNSILGSFFLYVLAGASAETGAWYALFAATGEYFYHANLKSPRWLRYFMQTPELHSVHHQLDLHDGNFGDITLWDRLFGTYRDTTEFVDACGFPGESERELGKMLLFVDVYESDRKE